MTSTLSIGDVVLAETSSSLFNGRSVHSDLRSNTPSPSLQSQSEFGQEPNPTQNARKRRRAAHLTRIAIGKLSTSNESLNSNSGSVSGSDDDSQITASAGDEDTQNQLWGSQDSGQKRFCPSSQVQKVLPSGQSSSQSSVEDCGGDDLVVVECSQSGSTSVKASAVASGGLLLNGTYEIVGNASECEAVNIHDKTIFHCLILKPDGYKKFLTVLERLKTAESLYDDEEEFAKLKNLLIPEETLTIYGNNGNWYVLLPHHQGNLHSMMRSTSSDSSATSKICSERRIQPIFKQIVTLVDFCHRNGIYFRDFRLRKFVFVDKEKTQIRLNSVLDLWVAPEIGDDQINQRYKSQVCPVYVAPEIFDMSRSYAGQPADVWGLGVLMFSLIMGKFPFHDPNPTAMFKRIKARRFSCQFDERVSYSARWLLHGLLRPLPADRPSAAEILQCNWLKVDSASLPDSRDSPVIQAKNIGSLTMNSQQSVFSSSMTSLYPPRNLSTSGPAVQNGEVVARQGSPPAFVRLGQSGNGSALGVMPPLQQAAQPAAIHVRLALVSPRPSSQMAQMRDTVAGSPLPHPLAHSTTDEVLDQAVPALRRDVQQNVLPGSSLAESGLALTVSDHYYSRGPIPSGSAVLSVQSFPPTGMVARDMSARAVTSVSRIPIAGATPSS
ncbi:protein kinase domain-containing protein [Ditylenchus destructor]|nr:protein kinase domain-containing protein [Ditylenchus destructor]